MPKATIVIAQGDPPGPAYVVEEGRLRSFHVEDGLERNLAYYRKGDVFGERALFLGEPRAASIEALDDCSLLMLPPELFQGLVDDYPEFRERIEERVVQYDYRRLARVPLDFADEILPAEASAEERRAAEEALAPEPVTVEELGEAEDKPRPKIGRRFPHVFQLDEMDCGAACLAMICRYYGRAVRSPTSARSPTRARAGRRYRDHPRGRGARSRRPARFAPRRAASTDAAAGDRPLAGRRTGSSCTESTAKRCGWPTRRAGCASTRASAS